MGEEQYHTCYTLDTLQQGNRSLRKPPKLGKENSIKHKPHGSIDPKDDYSIYSINGT